MIGLLFAAFTQRMSRFLNKVPNLKKFSSILLVFVFLLDITPKKTLHNWFANHKDITYKIPDSKTQQLAKAGFSCMCDDLVAEPHFIIFDTYTAINNPSAHSFISLITPSLFSPAILHYNLRGPPLKF